MKSVENQCFAPSGNAVVSARGFACLRTREGEGVHYALTLWLAGAADTAGWLSHKKALLMQISEAGILGKSNKRDRFAKQLDALFEQTMGQQLASNLDVFFTENQAEILNQVIDAESCVLLHAWSIAGNRVQIILELNGECGVAEYVGMLREKAPSCPLSAEFYVEAIDGEVAAQRMLAMLTEIDPQASLELPEETAPVIEAIDFQHETVLLHEAVEMLAPAAGKVIVDATLGGGGHTERMLEEGAEVWGIDQDPSARQAAQYRLAKYGERFHVLAGNFKDIAHLLSAAGVDKVDGILADLGVSSHQIDTAERGFSFRDDGPLDMRMSPSIARSAEDLVNEASEEQIATWLWELGEERASRGIARAICQARETARICTTHQLSSIIGKVLPRKGKQNPATRSFQALRIAVNDELGVLDSLLTSSMSLLKPAGRLALISFHSLEDRPIKRFFALHSKAEIDRPEWPAPRPNPDFCCRLLCKKPIVPSEEEIRRNPRSRSAKLRGIEMIHPYHAASL